MNVSEAKSAICQQIDLAESYLVCSMYDEAASLASTVLKRMVTNEKHNNVSSTGQQQTQFYDYDMMESSGMVLVQSLKLLGRSSEIFNELKILFDSVATIPVQVLLTGACFLISEGSTVGVGDFLEEFLSKWSLLDERYYVLAGEEINMDLMEMSNGRFVLEVEKYMEVVEVYAVTLLGTVLNDVDLAISWAEKATLTEEKRQELLRRLHSLYSRKATSNFRDLVSPLPVDHRKSSSFHELKVSEGSSKALKVSDLKNGQSDTKQAILKLSQQVKPCFWWFHTITLKCGRYRLVISNRKVALGCLIFLIYYVFRWKQATLKRFAKRQAFSIKKALVDLWQLAFSYQVNPLAAVQPLSAATHGGR
ncbi:hypothetical protein CFOL_v3_03275 [Cephalotus follicularis]|uniref:Uncharacterized protein n=1 Tax=Cephalotus follicularis TaxID=3775 RepID=A0A1Q3AVT7_CEPFO|nr:hypothetical protein CFOL_v3_03275 [Cephalotus follicularis]